MQQLRGVLISSPGILAGVRIPAVHCFTALQAPHGRWVVQIAERHGPLVKAVQDLFELRPVWLLPDLRDRVCSGQPGQVAALDSIIDALTYRFQTGAPLMPFETERPCHTVCATGPDSGGCSPLVACRALGQLLLCFFDALAREGRVVPPLLPQAGESAATCTVCHACMVCHACVCSLCRTGHCCCVPWRWPHSHRVEWTSRNACMQPLRPRETVQCGAVSIASPPVFGPLCLQKIAY